jgi:Beta-propeller repeat
MDTKARPCTLVVSLTLSVAVTLGPVMAAGAGASAPKLDWARSAGGANFDAASGIATDRRGNSYVTGNFRGVATFGRGEVNETVLSTVGNESSDIFVAKYAPRGNLLWARRAGGPGDPTGIGDAGVKIATDRHGNGYVTGSFTGVAIFGPGEANQTVLSSAGLTDMFLAKYAPDGALLWARSAPNVSFGAGFGIATDHRDNSYVTGRGIGPTTFGAGERNETVVDGTGLFLAKYNAAGALLWATGTGGEGSAMGGAIATDVRGNSYVTGNFLDVVIFGAGELNETVLGSTALDLFVAKYANDGSLVWARSDGGPDGDSGAGIAIDQTGNSYVTGSFSGSITFGADERKEVTLASQDGPDDIDAFVAKYGSSGKFRWARRAGAGGVDSADVGSGMAAATYSSPARLRRRSMPARPRRRCSPARGPLTCSSRRTTRAASCCR